MPQAKADALSGDARTTAFVAKAATFQHLASLAVALPLCRRRLQMLKSAGTAGMSRLRDLLAPALAVRADTLRQMASEKESFLHTRSSR